MFQIDPEPAWQVCEELEKQIAILKQEENAVEDVIRTLKSLHGFESGVGSCRMCQTGIRDSAVRMAQMRKALEDALIRYTGHEMRTIENGEIMVGCNRKRIAEMSVRKGRDAGAGNSGGPETTGFGY